ncbi:MAG: hypothetical protein N3A01_08530 [Bacteroidales bacterium]|nr:hypothetical protein [Bacteroidales bacterium]
MNDLKNFLIFLFFFNYSQSQPIKVITVAPLGLVNKVRVKYESQLSENNCVTVGSFFNLYYGFYPGFRLDPFLRYYFFSEKLNNFYTILKIGVGYFLADLTYQHITSTNDTLKYEKNNYKFFTYGLGVGLGYQWNIAKNIIIDSFVNFNFFSFNAPKLITLNNLEYKLIHFWHTTGPGAIINAHIGIGFKL